MTSINMKIEVTVLGSVGVENGCKDVIREVDEDQR